MIFVQVCICGNIIRFRNYKRTFFINLLTKTVIKTQNLEMQKRFNMKTGITFDEVMGPQEEIKQPIRKRVINNEELAFRLGRIITQQKRVSAAKNENTIAVNNERISQVPTLPPIFSKGTSSLPQQNHFILKQKNKASKMKNLIEQRRKQIKQQRL